MAEIVASGSWWTLDSDGLLDIFIEGDMPNYASSNYVPWSGKGSIRTVTIRDSVTSIGTYAFYRYGLTSVIIPDSVTVIGDYAFGDCADLRSITIPDSVIAIGSSAFRGCTGLRSITIPDSVTTIGKKVFSDCYRLTSVTIPQGAMRAGIFDGSAVSDITISDGATAISATAFSGCIYLTSVTIPNSVIGIGSYAFYGCSRLRSITIPDSVTAIGSGAFYRCSLLESITIPGSVIGIGSYAFGRCDSLRHVYYRGFEYDWNNVSLNENFGNAIIHYVPPVLHVGGVLDNGRISGEQFAFAPGDYEELSYVQSASMDGDEVQSDKLYAELRVTGNPEAWLSGWAGVSRMVPVWFTRYGQIDGHNTVSVIERREKYSQTT